MKFFITFALVTTIATQSLKPTVISSRFDNSRYRNLVFPELAQLNLTGIARKFGYSTEEHEVITEDGYMLTLFRISGNKGNEPVLLMHGILDSADTYILRGKTSMALTLHDSNYDVWIGNARGNVYSRKHKTLDPNIDFQFWDYTFHEIGYYDCPAIIDFILLNTGKRKLSVIAHSQGATNLYVTMSTRPEYNDRISVFIALAPAAFFLHVKPPILQLLEVSDLANDLLLAAGQEELFGLDSASRNAWEIICSIKTLSYKVCARGLIIRLAGYTEGEKELEPEFLSTLIGHYPSGASRKNLLHFVQSWKNQRFAQYDYGEERNLVLYNSSMAPDYDLSKVTARNAVFYGTKDAICSHEDVEELTKRLPNVIRTRVFKWSHIDFLWGKYRHKFLIREVLDILKKFSASDYF